MEGRGAGFGNLEIIVNGGRVTSHVHTMSKEQFQANFIPHDLGRHRVDVKFNGEKVPNSPWFVEVKDPNTPLLAPMLVANRGGGKGRTENGVDTVDHQDQQQHQQQSSSNNKLISSFSKLNSELNQNSLFQQSKTESNNFTSSFNSSTSAKFESNLSSLRNGVEDISIAKKKQNSSSDFEKSDFGSFSLLETPKLLASGAKSSTSKTYEEERQLHSSSSEHLNSFTPKTATSTPTATATYSTTIERSINTGTGYSSLNKPHEARVKGLTNGSSTMPKSSSALPKSLERRSSLHAKVAAESDQKAVTSSNGTNGVSSSHLQTNSSSSYNATSSSSYKTTQQSSSLSTVENTVESSSYGPGSPKLSSYKGTATKCKFVGETVRHFNAGKPATFELFAPGSKKGDVDVNIISKPYLLYSQLLNK